jgi:hypothetical protein
MRLRRGSEWRTPRNELKAALVRALPEKLRINYAEGSFNRGSRVAIRWKDTNADVIPRSSQLFDLK